MENVVMQNGMMPKLSVGDTALFGSYPQTAEGEVQPIRWRVLRAEESSALLISEQSLEAEPFQIDNRDKKKKDPEQAYHSILWSNCTLRVWLNNDFMKTAFSPEEQAVLLTEQDGLPLGENPPKPKEPVEQVFLLSFDEAHEYFETDDDRICVPTDYAVSRTVEKNGATNGCWWWLRSPGYSTIFASMVYPFGFVSPFGYDVYMKNLAVRPCVWVRCGE